MRMKNLGIEVQNEFQMSLDSRDGGIESLLGGPPLVGIFALDPKNLDLQGLGVSHNVHYATRA